MFRSNVESSARRILDYLDDIERKITNNTKCNCCQMFVTFDDESPIIKDKSNNCKFCTMDNLIVYGIPTCIFIIATIYNIFIRQNFIFALYVKLAVAFVSSILTIYFAEEFNLADKIDNFCHSLKFFRDFPSIDKTARLKHVNITLKFNNDNERFVKQLYHELKHRLPSYKRRQINIKYAPIYANLSSVLEEIKVIAGSVKEKGKTIKLIFDNNGNVTRQKIKNNKLPSIRLTGATGFPLLFVSLFLLLLLPLLYFDSKGTIIELKGPDKIYLAKLHKHLSSSFNEVSVRYFVSG